MDVGDVCRRAALHWRDHGYLLGDCRRERDAQKLLPRDHCLVCNFFDHNCPFGHVGILGGYPAAGVGMDPTHYALRGGVREADRTAAVSAAAVGEVAAWLVTRGLIDIRMCCGWDSRDPLPKMPTLLFVD
ncbi:MAG: hypothetical protein JWM68_3075 [Verrucomicrobiales bacterium]|nr:hypothetical protein [Verrucomicrobiales bacterium]